MANEFLDALPMYAFNLQSSGLKEYLVDVDMDPHARYNFKLTLSGKETKHAEIYGNLFGIQSGGGALESDYEVSPDALITLKRTCDIISSGIGTAIFIDYGLQKQRAGKLSLRAYNQHKMVPIFEKPGESDLTYDVDFDLLQRVIKAQPDKHCLQFTNSSQRDFLLQAGIAARAAKLIKDNPSNGREIQESVSKLINDMGSLFSVLTIQSRGK